MKEAHLTEIAPYFVVLILA